MDGGSYDEERIAMEEAAKRAAIQEELQDPPRPKEDELERKTQGCYNSNGLSF